MAWDSEFSDFAVANPEGLSQNKPGVRQYSDRLTFLRSDVKLFKAPADVKQQVRILTIPGHKHWAKQATLHYNLGSSKCSIACSSMKGITGCPACEESRKAYAKGDKKTGGALAGKTYWLSPILDRKNLEEGVQWLQYPDGVYQRICTLIKHPTTGAIRPFEHPIVGYDLFFTRRKETPSAMYVTIEDLILDPDQSPITVGDTMEALSAQTKKYFDYLREICPVENFLTFLDHKKVRELMAGDDASDDGYNGQDWDQAVANAPTAGGEQPYQAAPKDAHAAPVPQDVSPASEVPQNVAQTAEPAPPIPSTAGGVDMDALRSKIAQRLNKSKE